MWISEQLNSECNICDEEVQYLKLNGRIGVHTPKMYIHFAYFKSCLIIFVSCLCTNIYFFVLNIDDFLSAGAMLLSSLCLWLFTIQHIYVAGFAVTVYTANISLTEVNNNKYSPHLWKRFHRSNPVPGTAVVYGQRLVIGSEDEILITCMWQKINKNKTTNLLPFDFTPRQKKKTLPQRKIKIWFTL